jgi:uncharacterized membrane protein YedE/YeeE
VQAVEHFTPLASLAGGLLIGLAAALLLLVNGRIAGVSGLLGGLLGLPASSAELANFLGKAAFIAGLVFGGALMSAYRPEWFAFGLERSHLALLGGGLLVGVGTQLSGGCTSGHGICGLGRLSKRSLVAVLTFMLTAALTVWVVQSALGGAL